MWYDRVVKIGRNDPCPCGSGRKYKHCCLVKDEASRRVGASRQAGFETQGELDVSTSLQREITAEVEQRSFSSKEELDEFLGQNTAARDTTPIGDFEGLSPEQMNRLLNEPIDAIPDVVELVDHLPEELALEADLVRSIRWILGYLADHKGEVRLTERGFFPRVMCTRYLGDCDPWWREGMSVPSEAAIAALSDAHEFALAMGYLDESRSTAWITTEGAQLYASGRWGEAYAAMLRFAMDELDWLEWLDEGWRHDHFRIVQQAAPFVLRLLHHRPTGTEANLFERFATAFPLYAQPGANDPAAMDLLRDVFAILTLSEFCEPFGLVTLDYERSDGDDSGGCRYETTPLFRSAFRWKERA